MRSTIAVMLIGMVAWAGCGKKDQDQAAKPPPEPQKPTPTDPTPTPPPSPDPIAEPKDPAMPPADPAAMAAATQGARAFAIALYDALRGEPGNLFFTPASVRIALAMTAVGARGDTAAELTKVLGLPADPAAAAAGFAAILDSFAQRPKPAITPGMEDWQRDEAQRKTATVAIANRVWPQAGRRFEPSFVDTLAKQFGAPMQALDFAADHDAARKTINAWVAEQTAQKIPELLQPPDVQAATRVVLTNAIYFKAQWAEPFEPDATRDGEFTTDRGKKVKVPMMAKTEHLRYAEAPTYQALELPYADGSLAMTVILPKPGKPLAQVEADALAGIGVVFTSQRVALQLPRWKIDARFALADTLRKLGIRAAFEFGPADFSGIDGTRELFIGNVVHQAVITVDEHGTEAAAATAVGMVAGSAPPADPPKRFVADHPFVFVIRDAKTGVVLFVGRLADPTAAR